MVFCSDRRKTVILANFLALLACCLTLLLALVFIQPQGLAVSTEKERMEDNARIIIAGKVLSHMDFSYNPCENFFQYCTGNYAKKARIDVGTEIKWELYPSRDEFLGFVPRHALYCRGKI